MNKAGYVYILTNRKEGSLYIGVTSNLTKRIHEHKTKPVSSFTKTYNLDKLVYYEIFDSIEQAIQREKQLKNWHRQWKIDLITADNPEWNDLYGSIVH